jgi:hypothetical protein
MKTVLGEVLPVDGTYCTWLVRHRSMTCTT